VTRYLLDSNAVSDLVRFPQGSLADRVYKIGEDVVCTSIIVTAELRYGAAKRGSERLSAQLEEVLGALDIIPFESPADKIYADLRALLQKTGRLIGSNDLFIAAHALTLGCVIVTDNIREFERVPGLLVENWRR